MRGKRQVDLSSRPPGQLEHDEFSLSARVNGSTLTLKVPAEPLQNYAIEYRTNLTVGRWMILETFQGNGFVKQITDSVTNETSRFYRAVLLP